MPEWTDIWIFIRFQNLISRLIDINITSCDWSLRHPTILYCLQQKQISSTIFSGSYRWPQLLVIKWLASRVYTRIFMYMCGAIIWKDTSTNSIYQSLIKISSAVRQCCSITTCQVDDSELFWQYATSATTKASKHCVMNLVLEGGKWSHGRLLKTWRAAFKEDLETMKLTLRGAKGDDSANTQWRNSECDVSTGTIWSKVMMTGDDSANTQWRNSQCDVSTGTTWSKVMMTGDDSANTQWRNSQCGVSTWTTWSKVMMTGSTIHTHPNLCTVWENKWTTFLMSGWLRMNSRNVPWFSVEKWGMWKSLLIFASTCSSLSSVTGPWSSTRSRYLWMALTTAATNQHHTHWLSTHVINQHIHRRQWALLYTWIYKHLT